MMIGRMILKSAEIFSEHNVKRSV